MHHRLKGRGDHLIAEAKAACQLQYQQHKALPAPQVWGTAKHLRPLTAR